MHLYVFVCVSSKGVSFRWSNIVHHQLNSLKHFPSVRKQILLALLCIIFSKSFHMPVLVATRSKVKVCGISPAEIVGSNPTGGMNVLLL